jgi:hypothetical protein
MRGLAAADEASRNSKRLEAAPVPASGKPETGKTQGSMHDAIA